LEEKREKVVEENPDDPFNSLIQEELEFLKTFRLEHVTILYNASFFKVQL
jgi:hypothetical protein